MVVVALSWLMGDIREVEGNSQQHRRGMKMPSGRRVLCWGIKLTADNLLTVVFLLHSGCCARYWESNGKQNVRVFSPSPPLSKDK